MSPMRKGLLATMVIVLGSSGCCRWCERWCHHPQAVHTVPTTCVPCVPAPVCCPTPAGYSPAGVTTSAPQWQRTPGVPGIICCP